jgi:hypothetical protein
MPAIGERISITNAVQGVRYWKAEISINAGPYAELTEDDPDKLPVPGPYSDVASDIYWICPRATVGSGDTERLIYTFAFGYTLPATLTVGDVFAIKLTPAGMSSGMGAAIESDSYTVTEASSIDEIVLLRSNSFVFTDFILSL